MSAAGANNHPYHMVEPSPWPALGAGGALTLAIGAVLYMHDITPYVMFVGFAIVLLTMFLWWRDVVRESTREKAHTPEVNHGLRVGMGLFILSEVMFFVAFFWSYFHNAFEGGPVTTVWPPEDIEVFNPWGLPFINTIILVSSGFVLMWARAGLEHGDRGRLVKGLAGTVVLGFAFIILQVIEYGHAAFAFTDGIFPSVFFMATGFHGFHVFVGACFLTVCLVRANAGHFSVEKHVGLEAAEWYWHFVDVVWLFLFFWFYFWVAA